MRAIDGRVEKYADACPIADEAGIYWTSADLEPSGGATDDSVTAVVGDGSDGTRTRDLRRDRPAL